MIKHINWHKIIACSFNGHFDYDDHIVVNNDNHIISCKYFKSDCNLCNAFCFPVHASAHGIHFINNLKQTLCIQKYAMINNQIDIAQTLLKNEDVIYSTPEECHFDSKLPFDKNARLYKSFKKHKQHIILIAHFFKGIAKDGWNPYDNTLNWIKENNLKYQELAYWPWRKENYTTLLIFK